MLSADDIARLLDLSRTPRAGAIARRSATRQRSASAPILPAPRPPPSISCSRAGEVSRWHRVDASEVWHWYAGAPLSLTLADAQGRRGIRLGPDLAAGERPQAVVPAGVWQQAASLGDWTLVGCTVAPGFQFAGFELAQPGFEPGAGEGP